MERFDGLMDGRFDRWKVRWMEGLIDGRFDGWKV